MKYEQFLERVKEEIMPLLPSDVNYVTVNPVTKNNGHIMDGLVMVSQYLNISPTIYMNSYYNQYLSGRPFESILTDIADTYMDNRPKSDFDISQVKDWEKAKLNVVRKLVNYEANKELLEARPHKRVEDLAVVYQLVVNGEVIDDQYATIAVFNDYLKRWDISLEELDRVATENTNRLLPFTLRPMEELLSDYTELVPPFFSDLPPMYYLGNKIKLHGAVQVLNPQLMDSIKEVLGEEYYVIPSSIHEVLLMSKDCGYDYEEIESVIQEVNEMELDPTDILSNKAYMVDAVNHKLVLAERYGVYKTELRLCQAMEKENEKHIEEPKSPKM